MDYLGAKLGELRADERLSYENAGADRPEAFERSKSRDDGRSSGSLEIDNPAGKGLPQLSI
jgi:hypothetical protein